MLESVKGPLTLISGLVLYMVTFTQLAGIELIWGFVTCYIFSMHYQYNPNITANDIDLGMPMIFFGNLLGTVSATHLSKWIGLKPAMFQGLILQILGLLSIHLTFNSFVAVCVYGMLVGYGSSTLLVLAMAPSWSHYESRKGMVTGILFIGFGLGPAAWGFLIQIVSNPDNIPMIYTKDGSDMIFPSAVVDNFIMAVYYFIILIAVIGTLAVLGISVKPVSAIEQSKIQQFTFKDIMNSRYFWKMFIEYFLLVQFSQYISQSFKQIGMFYFNNDHLLLLCGSLSYCAGSCGRFVWPSLLDKYSYKKIISIITCLVIFLGLTLPFTFGTPYLYAVTVIVCFVVRSGIYPAIFVQCKICFNDQASEAFGYIHVAQAMGTFCIAGLKYAISSVGYWAGTYLITGISGMALIVEHYDTFEKKTVEEEELKTALLA